MAGQAELTSQQRRSLAEDGYLLLPSLLPAEAVAALAARLDELARAIIAERDAAAEQWDGVVSVRLDPADPGYAPLVRPPLLFSAADTVIGPGCQVDGLSLRAPLPELMSQISDRAHQAIKTMKSAAALGGIPGHVPPCIRSAP